MADFDTAALVARIIRDAKIPRGSQYRDTGVLLGMADDAMRTIITPELLKVGEGYLSTVKSYPLAQGQFRIRIPSRAVRLLDVSVLNVLGNPLSLFGRATVEQEREQRAMGYLRKPGAPRLWYLEGSTVVLSPPPDVTTAYTLVLRYARRPSRLVDPSTCSVVSVVNADGIGVTGPVLPLSGPLDIVKGSPGFESVGDDINFTLNGVYVTPGAATLALTEVGDYVCAPGTSPVPQIPPDYHAVLSQAVVVQVMKELRDAEGLAVAQGTLASLMASASPTIEARAEQPEVLVRHDFL